MIKTDIPKKQQILLIALGTAFIIVILLYTLIHFLQRIRESANDKIDSSQAKLDKYRSMVAKSDAIQTMMTNLWQEVEIVEVSVPKGDVYLWMLKNVEKFGAGSKIEFNQVEPPRSGEPDSIPTLPYPTAVFTVSGVAYYHDFGLFLADFENSFPFARLQSLDLEPAAYGRAGDQEKEKLRFKFEFNTPAKPSSDKL